MGPEVASRCAEFICAGLGCRLRGIRQRIFSGLQPFDSDSVVRFRSLTEHELSELTLCTSALLVFPVPTEQRFRTSGPVNLPVAISSATGRPAAGNLLKRGSRSLKLIAACPAGQGARDASRTLKLEHAETRRALRELPVVRNSDETLWLEGQPEEESG